MIRNKSKIGLTIGAIATVMLVVGCSDQATVDGKKVREWECVNHDFVMMDAMSRLTPSDPQKAVKMKEWLNTHPDTTMVAARYYNGQVSSKDAENFMKSYNSTPCPKFD